MTVELPQLIDPTKDPLHYPQSLFEESFAKKDNCHWHVLYTKSRQEKVVAERLLKRRVSFYLPLLKKTTYYRRCKKTVHVPLFSGYLFLYGDEDDRLESLKSNQICTTFNVSDEDLLVTDLKRIHHVLCSDAPVAQETQTQKGKRVLIRSGPMAGLEGTIIKRNKQLRVVVSVDFLQQGASVEVDEFMFEVVD